MNSKYSVVRSVLLTAALAAGMAGAARADDNGASAGFGSYNYFNHRETQGLSARAQEFVTEDRVLQDESTSMPAGSPRVDATARPADPVARATNLTEEVSRFRAMDAQLQREATPMPAGTPSVDRNDIAADPVPQAATKAGKAANFSAEEHFLERNSSP